MSYLSVQPQVNERFRTLEEYTTFRLTIRPVGFYIAESEEADSQWTVTARRGGGGGGVGGGRVDARVAVRNLARWVASSPGLPPHDHAMLMTGSARSMLTCGEMGKCVFSGRASVGTVCGGVSVSLVEDRGAFQSVLTAAHELAHGLGAGHDGKGNNCREADRFIMAGGTQLLTAANSRHPWLFSLCSARAITRHVSAALGVRSGAQCLTTALPQWGVPGVEGVIPGQLYPPDQQCRHLHGPSSRYCHVSLTVNQKGR
ncbi:metalloprotease mig-17-like [Babylonia areolata]|uniref:metalloprotease mig-17-like n=1 Tax=Babylonia areolata TaxID=304850 RepID=UPI003FD1D75B